MGTGKIEFKLGTIDFSGEGEEKWLAAQLDKVLENAADLLAVTTSETEGEDEGDVENGGDDPAPSGSSNGKSMPLAKYLQSCGATSNQIKRFLATAEWLTLRGTSKPTTREVSKALKDNHQPKLSNPADCLNKNVAKGHCEKDGKQFFVTPDGRKTLGK